MIFRLKRRDVNFSISGRKVFSGFRYVVKIRQQQGGISYVTNLWVSELIVLISDRPRYFTPLAVFSTSQGQSFPLQIIFNFSW